VEFERMVEMGLFDNERVELLRGFIVRMSPQKSRHAGAVQYLTQFFVQALSPSGRASVRVQLPLATGVDSEPEPDIALVPAGAYRDHHPDSAYLVVEVAETSLPADREKAEVYAEGGVEEYWIVDTVHELIEVRTEIVDGVYTRVTPYRRGQLIAPRAFADLPVSVADVLG
jgi:Uma2 family endonuclease